MIQQCFRSAKAACKNQIRYDPERLLYCLILHMKSPTTYEMLRDNKILPLPSESTIYKYMKKARSQGGFDPRYLALFAKRMEILIKLDPRNKFGILSLDEMHVREGLETGSDMTFFGVENVNYSVFSEATAQMHPKRRRH